MEHTLELSTAASQETKEQRRSIQKELPFAIGVPALIWQALFFYLPILLMVLMSLLTRNESGHLIFSLDHYKDIWRPSYISSILSSLTFSFSTAFLCACIGFPLAHFIAFRGGRYRTFLLFLIIIPFWTNFLLHIYAWFFVLEKEGFLNSVLLSTNLISEPLHFLNSRFAVMLMMVYYYLPFMTLPIYSSLEKFNPSLLEASYDLGASPFQTFRKVLLPLSLSAIRAGFFLVLIPAFGEFVIPELMGGDKDYYVGSVISQFILGDNTGHLGTAFTVVSVCALCLFIYLINASFNLFSKLLKRSLT